jgi:hypothetical protein
VVADALPRLSSSIQRSCGDEKGCFRPFAFPCRIKCDSLLGEAVPALALLRPLANVPSRLREVLVGGLTDDFNCLLGRSRNLLFVPDAAEVYIRCSDRVANHAKA